MDILQVIQKYGLSIRQIPNEVTSCYSIQHHKEGNEIIYVTLDSHWNYVPFKKKHKDSPNYIFDDNTQTIKRALTKETTVPNNAGHWMCKQVNNTSSSVKWNTKTDNLAPTLEESIKLFIEQL